MPVLGLKRKEEEIEDPSEHWSYVENSHSKKHGPQQRGEVAEKLHFFPYSLLSPFLAFIGITKYKAGHH